MTAESLQEVLGLDLLMGKASGVLEVKSNVVRVFISSTFSDMSHERDALLEKAYPELQVFCQGLGLVFEVVDMRWGVRDAITVDHMTTELCLREIKTCQTVSIGPAFTALVGNRYGYRPIPRVIQEKELELLLSKLSSDPEGVELLSMWFWKDSNSLPPTYILQPITTHLSHYDDTRPESKELRARDVTTWRNTETRLLQLLRQAALQAHTDGDFDGKQKHKFFKSVTEWEIEQGLLETQKNDANNVLFLRELHGLCRRVSQGQFSQFMDVTNEGLVDLEAQELVSSLKARISSVYSGKLNVHAVELKKGTINPQHREHAKYLECLCNQFITQMKQQIQRSATDVEGQKTWGWLLQEVNHHLVLSLAKCAVFCGRKDLLNRILESIRTSSSSIHRPVVVFGPSGIGKTALMCKLAQEACSTLGSGTVVVLRLLGTSPLSSEINLVLKSICFQICGAYGLPLPFTQTTNTHEDLVRFFHTTLSKASQQSKSLVIALDSLDQLSSTYNAHKLHWLPKEIPPNVHLIVSTLEKGYPMLEVLRGVIIEPQCFFEVGQLSPEQGGEMIDSYMTAVNRRLTSDQWELILGTFKACGHPLLLKLTLDAAKQWASYTPLSELQVATTTQEAVAQLFERLEKQHGKPLVSHALGYIVLSRHGLTEAELQDVLSLDDEVLADIYQYWPPPNMDIIRLPPLLWTRLRHDLAEYLVERQTEGIKVLGLYHRQFIKMVKKRYLAADHRTRRHSVLSDFFLGTWSLGNRKPVFLPSLQASLNADRKVAPQPLWFTLHVANQRKLHELPHHLLHSDRWEELQQEVIGNTEWLCSKILICGIASVITDLSMCAEHTKCPEIQLVCDTFLLLKPTLDFIDGQMDPSLFYTEVFARLHSLSKAYPALIGRLCSQCQSWFSSCANPILIPKCSFFQAPGGPLKTTLTGFQKGVTVMELYTEKGLLIVGSEDGRMIAWNLNDSAVIHTLLGHTAEVQCVRVVDKGNHCLSAARDNTLRLWNLLSGRQIYCIKEERTDTSINTQLHVAEERSIIYSMFGSQMNAWHLETAMLLFQISTEGQALIFAVIPESDGGVISLSEGGLLTFWDNATGMKKSDCSLTDCEKLTPSCVLPIRSHGELVIGTQEGSLYLVSSDRKWKVFKVTSSVLFLAGSDDEMVLCTGHEKQVAVFWVHSNSLERFLADCFEHGDIVQTAVFTNDRSMVITGAADETIRVWCLSNGVLLDSFTGMGASITTLVLFHNIIISASRNTYYLKVWQLNYNQKHKTQTPLPGRTLCPTLSHNGDFVYFLKPTDKKEVTIWDYQSGRPTEVIAVSAEICCLEVAQSKQLLFCGLSTGTVLIYPLGFSPDTMCIPPPESLPKVCCLGISKGEDQLAVAYEDSICVYDIIPGYKYAIVEGPTWRWPLPQQSTPLSCVAVLSDCRLVFGTDGGEVSLHDFQASRDVPLEGHCTAITCIVIGNHEAHALIGSRDSIQRLWNLSPLLLDHEMQYKGFFFDGILCAVFSEDDQYVYTGSQDRTIKVWEVSSGQLLVVQYVYASVTKILASPGGFVAISQLGYVIKEQFVCPEFLRKEYNPLQNSRAKYTVKSRERPFMSSSLARAKSKQTFSQPHAYKSKSSQLCTLF
ncbi:NACHT domain- and WD repeat-containing protein 1 [Amia ocellicauda]|uniref:NACHT domain- and WD repeat-containing protein 1 n=1 Tax=Amia ocellicauda TaxID=2972642 RepID=UPI003464E7A3